MENIEFSTPCHFKLDNNKNCPFLNDKNLCEIYINLGEKSLCNICSEHPRYYEWFKDVKEGGIGLCCEEAARIILFQNEPFETCNLKIPNESAEDYDCEVYDYLLKCREKIISCLDNTSVPLKARIRGILWYSNVLQQNLDSGLLDEEEIFDVKSESNFDIQEVFKYLLNLEANDEKWKSYLTHALGLLSDAELDSSLSEFETQVPEVFQYLKNIAIYFIWRYFMKATFDYDVLSKVKLMAVSVAVIQYLFFCDWLEHGDLSLDACIAIVKKYSEEIEYCEENLTSFADASYELGVFSVEGLIGLFM